MGIVGEMTASHTSMRMKGPSGGAVRKGVRAGGIRAGMVKIGM